MILVDTSTGSNELVEPLEKLGLPVKAKKMDFGDLVFYGRGVDGEPLKIGIEYKKLGELCQSLMSKRFQGHQLLGLTKGFDRRYLLIEGDWHHTDKGVVIQYRGKQMRPVPGAPSAVVLEQELLNIATRGGCVVVQRSTRRDCLRWVLATYRYWTDKDLDEHKSHLAMYAPDLDRGLLTPPTDFRKAMTVLLPNIGYAISKTLEDAVGGTDTSRRVKLHRTLALTLEQWARLETVDRKGGKKRLGAARAQQIMEAFNDG